MRSPDGTVIGAEVLGSGPPVVLVHGSTADRSRWAPLVPQLIDEFTLVLVDRRGRGASTDEAAEYGIDREGADLLAVLDTVAEPALVFGHSYGALITLRQLERLGATRAVLLYEPPSATHGEPVFTAEQMSRWQAALDAGRRVELLEMFFREALLFDDAALDAARTQPIWQARLAAVHTLVREARAVAANTVTAATAPVPVRFLLGEATTPHLMTSTRAAAGAVAGSELVMLRGLGHTAIDAAPEIVARHVRETWQAGSR